MIIVSCVLVYCSPVRAAGESCVFCVLVYCSPVRVSVCSGSDGQSPTEVVRKTVAQTSGE